MVIIVMEAMELVMLIGAMSFIVTVMVVMEVMVDETYSLRLTKRSGTCVAFIRIRRLIM